MLTCPACLAKHPPNIACLKEDIDRARIVFAGGGVVPDQVRAPESATVTGLVARMPDVTLAAVEYAKLTAQVTELAELKESKKRQNREAVARWRKKQREAKAQPTSEQIMNDGVSQ